MYKNLNGGLTYIKMYHMLVVDICDPDRARPTGNGTGRGPCAYTGYRLFRLILPSSLALRSFACMGYIGFYYLFTAVGRLALGISTLVAAVNSENY